MLVTTLRCWWRFGKFGHQHPLSFYISVEQQHSKDVNQHHCHQSRQIPTFIVAIVISITKASDFDLAIFVFSWRATQIANGIICLWMTHPLSNISLKKSKLYFRSREIWKKIFKAVCGFCIFLWYLGWKTVFIGVYCSKTVLLYIIILIWIMIICFI